MVKKLVSQLCYIVVHLSFKDFQKYLGLGLAPSPHNIRYCMYIDRPLL